MFPSEAALSTKTSVSFGPISAEFKRGLWPFRKLDSGATATLNVAGPELDSDWSLAADTGGPDAHGIRLPGGTPSQDLGKVCVTITVSFFFSFFAKFMNHLYYYFTVFSFENLLFNHIRLKNSAERSY